MRTNRSLTVSRDIRWGVCLDCKPDIAASNSTQCIFSCHIYSLVYWYRILKSYVRYMTQKTFSEIETHSYHFATYEFWSFPLKCITFYIFRYSLWCNGFVPLVFLFSWRHVVSRWFYLSSAQEDCAVEGEKGSEKRTKEDAIRISVLI